MVNTCVCWYVSVKSVFLHEIVCVFMCACMSILTIFYCENIFARKIFFLNVLIENFLFVFMYEWVYLYESICVYWYVYVFFYVYIGVISVYLCVCGWKVFVIVHKCLFCLWMCVYVCICLYELKCMYIWVSVMFVVGECMCMYLCI